MSRSDFWEMYPTEFHWLLDAKTPRQTYAGGMTETEVAALYERAYGDG